MIKAFLLALLLFTAFSGRILNGDVEVDYANAGIMKEISFSFLLENAIDQSDYIKIAMPFPLHAALNPAVPATQGLSSPSKLVITYQTMDEYRTIDPTVNYAQILTETIDSSNYFIRFYASDRKTLIPIPANQWYYIKFIIQDSNALQYQKASSILQIQMSTVSSVFTNSQIYDDNLAFNYLQLSSTPAKTITLQTTPYSYGSAGGYLLMEATYNMYLDVSLNISTSHFSENLVLKFLVSEQDSFKFTGTCSSVAKTNAPTIALLDASLYTCSIDSMANIMEVILKPSALTLQTSYRFTVGIQNPPIVVKDVSIIVRAVKDVSKVVIAFGQAVSALNTNQIYVTYQEIFLGWGMRPDALLPFDVRIFRGNAQPPTYMPYNSIFTKFSISQATSPDVQLKIIIDIPSESKAFVLPNGYTFNLPAFPNKQVRCVVENDNSPSSRQIGCTGIGALSAGTVYNIGWKMFFPYDNYESSINCTSFGTLTVYSTKKITSQDVSFVLGRGNQFLDYLKSSPDYNVIGRNSSYITYMKTFEDLNLIALSSDFQQFLKYPEDIFLTNRPKTYANKNFNDVYVSQANLAFLTYLSLFDDIYVAYRLKSDSDIVKGYDTYPMIAKTTPKNTLTIKTANSQNWNDFSLITDPPVVSSSATVPSNTPTTGLVHLGTGTSQSLIFTIKGLFADVTTFDATPGTSITDNWGLLIMMNSKIALPSTTLTLKQASPSSLTISGQTVSSLDSYNKYTLITIKGSTSGVIQTLFPTTASRISFGISPVTIDSFSSIYADEQNLDIMIAAIDGVDGPLNKITQNGFFLINAFTMKSSTLSHINYGLMNYFVTTPLDGSKVPTFFRFKGDIADTDIDSLTIFFDNLKPFYENYYTGDIFCYSSDGTNYCTYYDGSTTQSKFNYHSLPRFQIPLTNPSTSFDILIPVTFSSSVTQINFYVAYQKKDPSTSRKYIYSIQSHSVITLTASGVSASGVYGPKPGVTDPVGATLTSMTFQAKRAITINQNSANSIGGGFTYFSEWDYIGTSSISGWTASSSCIKLSYLYYYTNYDAYLTGTTFAYSYIQQKGFVCFTDTSSLTPSTLVLTISSATLPAKWGKTLPGYGAYSQNNGILQDLRANSNSIQLSQTATGIEAPIVGPSLVKSLSTWKIPLPVSLDGNVKIQISSASNMPFDVLTGGFCSVYKDTTLVPKISCSFSFNAVSNLLEYILTIKQSGLLPKSSTLMILHYGFSSNTQTNTITANFVCYSLLLTNTPAASQTIFSASSISIPYQPASYLGATSLRLASFTKFTLNKASYSNFNFSFTLISKGLYATTCVSINLGQLATDNSASSLSPKCEVLTYRTDGVQQYSHDWRTVDSSKGLDTLQLWPQNHLLSTNLTYTLKCYNFITTSNPTPSSITAKVTSSSILPGDVSSTTNIVPMSTTYTNTKTSQITLSKKYTIPSSLMEMNFAIISPGITVDSFMYLGFPAYYSNGLGPDIKCYTTNEIYCTVKDRFLTIKYLGTYTQGTNFTLTVTGITQPINYNSGVFYFLIDTDDNPIQLQSSGTFVDSVSSTVLVIQNFPTFSIYSMTQSSKFLREENIVLTMDFFLPSSLPTVSVGSSLFLIFPPIYNDILRFVSPICTLNIKGNSLKNYINSCSIRGLRLQMPFLDNAILGSTYTLKIEGLINPTNPSSNIYRYSLEISNSNATSIIAKSYSPYCNFQMPIFIMNPNRLSLNYYTNANGLVTKITTFANVQSQQVFISPGSDLSTSIYQRNVYLSVYNELYSIPDKVDLPSGSNPFPIRMSSLTAGVNYVYFSKSGDGNFYSNLPPLILISNKNYFTPISFKQTVFQLPIGSVGSNYSLVVNLPFELYPMSQVTMNVSLSNENIGLSLQVNPTIITFYPAKTMATIRLSITDSTLWTVGKTLNLIITPANTNTYASSASITLNAIAGSSGTPTLSITPQVTNIKDYSFNFTCSQQGKFIYHISKKYSYNTTACVLDVQTITYWLAQTSLDGLRLTQTFYQCQDILKAVNVATPGTQQTVLVSNLLASTSYNLYGYCQTQSGLRSAISQLSFATQSNGGVVSKMDFFFEQELTTVQKIKLVCALALYFKVDYQKVSTWDGYYCSELLNRLLQQESTDLQISQQVSLRSQTLSPSISISKRILVTSLKRVEVYFGINNGLNSDTSQTFIATQSALSGIKNEINNNVVGLPHLDSYNVNAISYSGVNSITSEPFISVGPQYMFMTGLTLSSNGLVYIIVGQKDKWTRQPLISQIKQGSGPDGTAPLFYRVLAYRSDDPNSGNMAWVGVPQGQLIMFMMPSDDNPFDNANFGPMVNYTFAQQYPKWSQRTVFGLICLLFVLSLCLE